MGLSILLYFKDDLLSFSDEQFMKFVQTIDLSQCDFQNEQASSSSFQDISISHFLTAVLRKALPISTSQITRPVRKLDVNCCIKDAIGIRMEKKLISELQKL